MIGFTGPFSDVNFGDYAMLVNNIHALDAKEATVFVYDRPFIEMISERYFQDRTVQIVEVRLRQDFLMDGRDVGCLSPLEVLRAVENIDEVKRAVAALDTLYVNGGGYLNSLWAQPHRIGRLLQIIAPALIAATMGKPVVFTANGFGPFRGDTEFFASFFGSLPEARFAARDSILSPHWLSKVGIAPERVSALPDDLLFIEDALLPGPPSDSDRYVVMETYLPVEYIEENLAQFERFVYRMRDEQGLRAVFLPFHLAHGGVDQGRLLAARVPAIEMFDISDRGYLPIEDAVRLIRDAELVVSSRYHAVILALGQGTPFASVLKDVLGDKQYYYGKNAGALQTALQGQPHDLRDYFFLNYTEALEALADDFNGIVRRQTEAYEAAFSENARKLRAARTGYLGSGN